MTASTSGAVKPEWQMTKKERRIARLEEELRYVRQSLREQAADHHDYRAMSDVHQPFGHKGKFDECTTMRCEGVRRVLVEWKP